MSTSSTINAAPVTCPDWCVVPAETHAMDDSPAENLHKGPWFGESRPELHGSDGLGIRAHIEEADLSLAELRQHIADEIALAEWIEAHQ
jgi:hypothetical protein